MSKLIVLMSHNCCGVVRLLAKHVTLYLENIGYNDGGEIMEVTYTFYGRFPRRAGELLDAEREVISYQVK